MASGLFKIVGGSMTVPAMIILFGFPPHVAVNVHVHGILIFNVDSASPIYLGHIPRAYKIPVIPGALIGAKIGAFIK